MAVCHGVCSAHIVRALVTAEKSDLDLVLMQWWKPSWSMKCQVKPVVMRTRPACEVSSAGAREPFGMCKK
eukprot:6423948-Amphidinium_carterae.2